MKDCNGLIVANFLEVKPSSDLIPQEVQRRLLEPGQEVHLHRYYCRRLDVAVRRAFAQVLNLLVRKPVKTLEDKDRRGSFWLRGYSKDALEIFAPATDGDHGGSGARGVTQCRGECLWIGRRIAGHQDELAFAQRTENAFSDGLVMRGAGEVF